MADRPSRSQPRFPESSALSHSTSQSKVIDNQKRQALANGSTTFFDRVFPLVDEMMKVAVLPPIMYNLFALCCILQFSTSALWPCATFIYDFGSTGGKILKIIMCIGTFSNLKDDFDNFLILFIVLTIILLLLIIDLVLMFAVYSKHRRFFKWSVYVTRALFEFVPMLVMIPSSYLAGSLFQLLINDGSPKVIILFALSVLYYGVFAGFLYVQINFFSCTPYLNTGLTSAFDGPFYSFAMMYDSFFPILSAILQSFDDWVLIVLVVIKILGNVYIAYRCHFGPVVGEDANAIFGGIKVAMSAMDVVAVINIVGVSLPDYVAIIVFFGFFLSMVPLLTLLFKRENTRIAALLSEEALGQSAENPPANGKMVLGDQVRRSHFSEYGLDKDARLMEKFIHVGLIHHCDLFLDFSLVKFAAECYQDAHMLCVVLTMVTLFPQESRLLNYFFVMASSLTSLSFDHRFLLYQVNQIKELRQSSVSTDVTDKLLEMKRVSQNCVNSVRHFWSDVPKTLGPFYDIRKQTELIEALYNESLDRWPNNSRFCEDYSKFLVEGATDFTKAAKIKNRSELIEQGKSYVVDIAFRSLVRAYPTYLKKGIVDFRGNIIKNNTSNRGSSNNSSSNRFSTGTISGDLDVELEEELARQMFNFYRPRLAYQRAIENKRSPNLTRLQAVSVMTAVISIGIFVFLFVWYFSLYDPRSDNMTRQFIMSQCRFGYDAALNAFVLADCKTAVVTQEVWDRLSLRTEIRGDYNIDLTKGAINEVAHWSEFSRTYLADFMLELVSIAEDGEDVQTICRALVEPIVKCIYCDTNSMPMEPPQTQTLKGMMLSQLILLRKMISENKNIIPQDIGRCQIVTNIHSIAEGFADLVSSLAADQETQRDEVADQNKLILILVLCIFIVVTLPFLLLTLFLSFRELDKLLKIIRETDESARIDATKPMKGDTVNTGNEEGQMADNHKSSSIYKPLFYGVVTIQVAISVAIILAFILVADSQNMDFLRLSQWMEYGSSRAYNIFEAMFYTLLAMTLQDPDDQSIGFFPIPSLTVATATTYAEQCITELVMANSHLLKGTGEIESCVGFDAHLDDIHLQGGTDCTLDGSLHDEYVCGSLDHNIDVFASIVTQILKDPQSIDFTDPDSLLFHMFHLANVNLLDLIYETSFIFSNSAQTAISSFHQQLYAFCFGGIAATIIVLALVLVFMQRLKTAYIGALQLLRRLTPPSVLANTNLLDYLMNRKAEHNQDKMTASKSIIMLAHDAVFCISRSETIEEVNTAAVQLFGYSPEQLLGQPISTLFPPDIAKELYTQLNLMRSGQCPLIIDLKCVGLTDDELQIPVHINLMGIPSSPGGNVAKSFVIIARDETELENQMKAAEAAKAQSENLLYQILPRDIVVRLNRGESDISFTVPCATIIFVDIVKFSDYSATLAPAQIMENLSTVFARFDLLCKRYSQMTKIKLIGDVYMATAGLFSTEEKPSTHASQVVQFGLDVLTALDEINATLESNLQVRIGVNTDGPIIAGVLGTDKPVFDIIGDPINVAARLQSNGIPNTVQISQGTYEAIQDMHFNVEQRGEIELKGKGKKMAYIVRPSNNSSFFIRPDSDPTIGPLDSFIS